MGQALIFAWPDGTEDAIGAWRPGARRDVEPDT